jgi:berberine-like enzyme
MSSAVAWCSACPASVRVTLMLARLPGAMLRLRYPARSSRSSRLVMVPASPATSLLQEMPYRDALRHWAGPTEQEDPAFLYIKSEYFDRPLPPEAVTGLIAHLAADRRGGQARELDFTPWGGAYNQVSQTATAFAHRTPLYLVKHTASAQPHPGATETTETAAAHQWASRSWQQLHRWGTGQVFPSFPDPDLRDWGHAYYGANYRRLLAVKARYDPGNRFRSRQSLGPITNGSALPVREPEDRRPTVQKRIR